MPKKPHRRTWGTGSITWLTTTKVRLRVRTPHGIRSRTMKVAHRDHGGRGEAEAALSTLGTAPPVVSSWTLNDAFDAYIADAQRLGRTGGTLTSYRQVKARLDYLGSMSITYLTPEYLDRLYGDMAEKYSPGTIQTTHQVIRAVLERAVEWGRLTSNPARAARTPAVKRRRRTELGPADVWVLVTKALEADDTTLGMAIFLAAMTGARRGELSGLQWRDVDWASQGINISRQWATGPDGKKQVQDLKSASGTDGSGQRWVWIGQGATDALRRYKTRLSAQLRIHPDGWLLSYDGGVTPIKPNSLGGVIIKHCRDHGYDVTTHDFRRFSASELIAAGADVSVSADRLGHTPHMMLDRYARARKDKAILAGQALEARLVERGLPIGEVLKDG